MTNMADSVQLLDVRKRPAYLASQRLIPGAAWYDPEHVADWAALLDRRKTVVVYCVHGHHVSQGCADTLAGLQIDARYLVDGFEGWYGADWPTTMAQDPS